MLGEVIQLRTDIGEEIPGGGGGHGGRACPGTTGTALSAGANAAHAHAAVVPVANADVAAAETPSVSAGNAATWNEEHKQTVKRA